MNLCIFLKSTTALAAIGALLVAPIAANAQSLPDFEAERERSYPIDQVGAPSAYSLGFTGAGVLVGVVDSGLDTRHPEFDGRLRDGFDFANDRPITGDGNFDSDSHGTHVTGIIAAARDGIPMQGVAYGATIIPAAYGNLEQNPAMLFNDSWRFLADQGVSIINNSIGLNDFSEVFEPPCNVTDVSEDDLMLHGADMVDAMRYVVDRDILMVFATGNESQPSPDVLAGTPFLVPDFKDNWLAVGAVDRNNQLADFSNRCGVAADWCLVAPGVEVFSTFPLGTSAEGLDYDELSGTSMATPVVSGVAALVKEAFPFFGGSDLQKVLLTTATDLGDRDAFGRGLVNAEKAVRGFGAFLTDTLVDTMGFDATFSNDIGGAGLLVKSGEGALILTGENTYSGGTVVLGGALHVNGSLVSAVDVGESGTLRGNGAIDAPLTVAGRIAPGNSPGTMTVAGPVTLMSDSISQFDIDGPGVGDGAGNYSRLLVVGPTGTIALDGTLDPNLRAISGSATNTYVAPLGARFDVIEASAGVTGSFAALTQPGAGTLATATRFDTIYGANTVSLAVTPVSFGDLRANGITTTPNQNAIGRSLNSIRPVAGTRSNALFSSLFASEATALSTALGQLSNEIHPTTRQMNVERANMLRDATKNRLRSAALADEAIRPEGASIWGEAYGGFGDADGTRTDNLEWDTSSLLLGADMALGETTRLGLALGLGGGYGDIGSQRSSVDATYYDLAIYGATAIGAVQLDYGVARSWTDIETVRNPSFGAFNETLRADYDADSTQVYGEAGYQFGFAQAAVTPFVSGAYVRLDDADFAERGGVSALSGRVEGDDLGFSLLGVRVSQAFALGSGVLSASAMGGWEHAYGDTSANATARLAGGTPFNLEGAEIARDAFRLDLGASYSFTDRFDAGASYRGKFSGDANVSSFHGEVKVSF